MALIYRAEQQEYTFLFLDPWCHYFCNLKDSQLLYSPNPVRSGSTATMADSVPLDKRIAGVQSWMQYLSICPRWHGGFTRAFSPPFWYTRGGVSISCTCQCTEAAHGRQRPREYSAQGFGAETFKITRKRVVPGAFTRSKGRHTVCRPQITRECKLSGLFSHVNFVVFTGLCCFWAKC